MWWFREARDWTASRRGSLKSGRLITTERNYHSRWMFAWSWLWSSSPVVQWWWRQKRIPEKQQLKRNTGRFNHIYICDWYKFSREEIFFKVTFLYTPISQKIDLHFIYLFNFYRQPCVAMRRLCFATVYLFFSFFFYSTLVLRNYSTDSHKILRNCVFWCSLNNPLVLKFFGRHLAEKNAKNSENLVKISRVDSDFRQ